MLAALPACRKRIPKGSTCTNCGMRRFSKPFPELRQPMRGNAFTPNLSHKSRNPGRKGCLHIRLAPPSLASPESLIASPIISAWDSPESDKTISSCTPVAFPAPTSMLEPVSLSDSSMPESPALLSDPLADSSMAPQGAKHATHGRFDLTMMSATFTTPIYRQ